MKVKLCIFIVLMLLSSSAITQEIDWYSMDGGGGISTGDNNIQLIGVIGQTDTTRMSAGNISLSGGYLALPADADSVFKDSYEN